MVNFLLVGNLRIYDHFIKLYCLLFDTKVECQYNDKVFNS